MPNFSAKITESKITVGQAEGNHFFIEITPDPAGLNNVIVRVSMPCGPRRIEQRTFLLDDATARPNVSYLLPANADKSVKIDPLAEGGRPAPPSSYVAWETPSRGIVIGAGTTMKIEITGLSGNLPSGTANLIVGIRERGSVESNRLLSKPCPLKSS